MKFSKYKPALFLMIFLFALVLGLYLENKYNQLEPTKLALMSYDAFLLHGLRTGQIVCTEKIVFILKYPDKEIPVSTKLICDQWIS